MDKVIIPLTQYMPYDLCADFLISGHEGCATPLNRVKSSTLAAGHKRVSRCK